MTPPPADPPEEPRRPLRPTPPPPAGAAYEREVVAPVEDPYRTELLLLIDRLRSLRTWVAIVGVIAVAGLAVAVYALINMEEESDAGGGASRERVASLEERVDALEADVRDRATTADVNQIANDVQALEGRVDQVARQARSAASSGGTDEQARSSIDQLNQNVETLTQSVTALDQRVGELEAQSQP